MVKKSALHAFVYEWRYSVILCCLGYGLFSWTLFTVTGLLTANHESLGFQSERHLLGMLLLMGVMPTWLIGCMFVTQRHSFAIAQQLKPSLAHKVAAVPMKYLWIGILGGLVYALSFNVPIKQLDLVLAGNRPMQGIFIGQILVWVFVGWMLAVRLYVGSVFYHYGKEVPVTVFEQSGLEPFARVGLLDVAIIVGCLAVSTVQSIDAQFRLENYLTAMVIAIPATLALLIRPMWSVHGRLLARKNILQNEIRKEIRQIPETTDRSTAATLELLLQRRDRVNALHTWPLDFAIWSRLFFCASESIRSCTMSTTSSPSSN